MCSDSLYWYGTVGKSPGATRVDGRSDKKDIAAGGLAASAKPPAANRKSIHFIREIRQALAPQWLPQLQQTARLDLSNPFARDAIRPRHLFQGARMTVAQSE